ncbi:MAG: glycosyltransferase family 39 protein, partial [Alphaproteobacteria bacterium]|nr:glycosyltransferase family 39 protein [Alphaproteobacteria bacterium]
MTRLLDKVAQGQRLTPVGWLMLLLLCAAMFLSGLAALPPTDRDESSFAQATKQMVETGNYVDIRLQDKPRYQKPIGIYWLQAASVRLLDRDHLNEIWAYRVPSFIGMTIAVLMTAALGCVLFNARVGFLAALMLAGCLIANVEARLAKTDASLLATIMVAQYGLAVAYRREAMQWGVRLAFWTALGIGILIKGPMVLLPVAATLLWLWRRDNAEGASTWQWLRVTKPVIGLPWMLLIVVPWFVAIMHASHGAFAEQSAGHDMLAKIWQGQNRGIVPPGAHAVL